MKKLYFLLLLLFGVSVCHCQERIEMKFENGIYTIPCTVNDLRLRFIFDTGATDVSISATEVIFMLKNGYLQESDFVDVKQYLIADGSIVENTIINIRELKIGGIVLKDVKASVTESISAPLLLGQSVISQLGPWYIKANYLYLGMPKQDIASNVVSSEDLYKKAVECEVSGDIGKACEYWRQINNIYEYGVEYVTFVIKNKSNNEVQQLREHAVEVCVNACISGDIEMKSILDRSHRELAPENIYEHFEFYKTLFDKVPSPSYAELIPYSYYTWAFVVDAQKYATYLKDAAEYIETYIKDNLNNSSEGNIQYYKEVAAEQYYELGDLYMKKYAQADEKLINCVYDNEKALMYYRKAASLSIEGMYRCGYALYYGIDVFGKNVAEESIDWLEKAAKSKHVRATKLLLDAYFYGSNVVQCNNEKAIEYGKMLLACNDERYKFYANAVIGFINFFDYEDYTSAYAYLSQAYKDKDVKLRRPIDKVFSCLGDCYYFGLGTSVNYSKAFQLYCEEYESNKNDTYCIYRIACMYKRGLGVMEDKQLAFEYFQKGANMGDAWCQTELCRCYYLGDVVKDLSKAIFWGKKAVDNDDNDAHIILGVIYMEDNVYHDIFKAVEYLEMASKNGDGYGSYLLGEIYEFGKNGVQKNYRLAGQYYKLAAEQGYAKANEKLYQF